MSARTPRRGHGVTGALSGASLVAVTRGLPEPWPTLLAFAAPAVAVGWAFLQAAVFDKLAGWQVKRLAAREAEQHRRLIAELISGLAEAKQDAKAMPNGDARSRLEQELQQLEDAISASRVEFLWRRLQSEGGSKLGRALSVPPRKTLKLQAADEQTTSTRAANPSLGRAR